MTVVLDASAVMTLVRGEAGAGEAAEALVDGAAVSAVNFAEARDSLARGLGRRDAVHQALDSLLERGVKVVPCDRVLAARAADIRSERYRRRSRAVSLGDCFAIAAAEAMQAPLVTSDRDQAAVAREVGVTVLAIPNSSGERPDPEP